MFEVFVWELVYRPSIRKRDRPIQAWRFVFQRYTQYDYRRLWKLQAILKSILYFNTSKTGVDPNRRTMYEMKLSINEHVDVSFPYYERRKIESVVPGSAFVTIIPSPGCAFIVRAAINVNEITATLVLNVVKVWPLLLVSYCIATLFGILIWFTVGFFPCCPFHCYFASLLEVVKMDLF